ncbi:MAG: radical SAM protein [Candidatus Omnitrophica bacterium 4484_171]|nr:MAG: radical SAM protein [Candidatus Omnitrophica bacterium 4484_171]
MRAGIRISRQEKIQKARDVLIERLAACDLCPRACGVNRMNNEEGFCKTGRLAKVNSAFLHFGEERELTGGGGSGTIFFSNCNLNCVYCQNYEISQLGSGEIVSSGKLADMMIRLQQDGAENINFVTPTHVIAQIVEALCIAYKRGLCIPLVYNCGGYESSGTLKLIDGIFDIYMPDIKYSDNRLARTLSGVYDYWEVSRSAVLEMHRQAGDLIIDNGAAKKGLLIRHLVLPGLYKGAFKIIDFIRNDISVDTYVNIMDQYRPYYRAYEFNQLQRVLAENEYREVINYARDKGLYRGLS